MSAVTELFFDTVYFPRSRWTVVRWWEARRPLYNVAVGAAGVVTLAVATVVGLPLDRGTLTVVGVYALVANVCYSLGPLLDLAARRVGGADYAPVGPTLFRYGFVFSIGLTLFPALLATLVSLVRLALWLGRIAGG